MLAAEEDIEPALRDHWDDVCAAFHDTDAHHLYVKPDGILAALEARKPLRLSSISGSQPLEFRAQAAEFAARSLREAEPELEKLVALRLHDARHLAQPRRRRARRLQPRAHQGALGRDRGGPRLPGGRTCATASSRPASSSPSIPEHRLIHRRKAAARPARRGRGLLRSFTDLRTGDHVVHEDHGVARFAGFDTKTVGGITRDYLNLEFQGDDKVFMPVDQLAKISRYVGADGNAPALSKLGGTRWDKIKARARRAAQELAGELLNLYAERKRRRGHAFEPDSDWLREFEAAFPYRETPDQREAIEAVKADMESERPMDRLICGDVGYGKTEVALRAAFKAANAGKQVLMLVPTTILAQQHYGTFAERLRDYPFTIEHVVALPPRGRAARGGQALRRGQGRHPDRHPPRAQPRRAREGPRPDHRRRGAALRRQAEGAAAPAQAQGRRDLDERDADPAHAADEPRRPARHHRDRDAAGGPPARSRPTSASTTRTSSSRRSSASTRAAARRSSCTTASRTSTRRPSGCARCARSCASPSRTGRWTRSSSRSG